MGLRLYFNIPQFLRTVWVNPQAREVWEPRIRRVSNAWHDVERAAVIEGVKPSALQTCSPDNLVKLTRWALDNKIFCLPLGIQGVSTCGYGSGTIAHVPGKPFEYRVILANLDTVNLFEKLWNEGDDDRMGALLGFPGCCRKFFDWAWVEQSWNDTTLPMSINPHLKESGRAEIADKLDQYPPITRVGGPIECNILLRWLGIRSVSHLPCSFYCKDTERVGKELREIGAKSGFAQEMEWLERILDWPISWTSLHGVATITTPVFRLITNSTPVTRKITIERDGSQYPEEGARGNEFPFKNTQRLLLWGRSDFSDNGFKSRESMEASHDVVLEAVLESLTDTKGKTDLGKVIDLGCGNGALLEKIVTRSPWLVPCGIEEDSSKHQRAARRLLAYDPELHLGNLHDARNWHPPYSVGIVSLARLTEAESEGAKDLLERLRDGCERVVIYSYSHGEWPGFDGINEFLELVSQHGNTKTCAVMCKPRRSNGGDTLQK